MRRRRRPRVIKEAARLDVPQRRPPPDILTEVAILHGESDAGELLKIFARSIMESASDAAPSSKADEASNDDIIVTVEAAEAKNPGKAKHASKQRI